MHMTVISNCIYLSNWTGLNMICSAMSGVLGFHSAGHILHRYNGKLKAMDRDQETSFHCLIGNQQ